MAKVTLYHTGVGLNLTMASHVYMMDLAWNPATEDQAIDRVHRIGQTRPVVVRRFVIKVPSLILCFLDRLEY